MRDVQATGPGRRHRPTRDEEKNRRIQEEREKVREYNDMLAEQEARNKQKIPPARGGGDIVDKGSPRRLDAYSEEKIMQQLHSALRQKDEADKRVSDYHRGARQSNQEFLKQQIEERSRLKRQAECQKGEQRVLVQAATEQFAEAERNRIEQQRCKNVKHRQELENQILGRKVAQKNEANNMTPAEIAINRHLLGEANELRSKMDRMVADGLL